jgi:hypothetical protein
VAYGRPDNDICPECGGTGYLKSGDYSRHDPLFGTIVRCEVCSEPGRRDWLRRYCGLEGVALEYGLDDWRPGKWEDDERAKRTEERQVARGAIVQALERQAGLLTFWGDFGAGKTFALQIVANETRRKMIESHYVRMADVLEHLRALYGQKVDTSPYWQRLLDVPVLCLDEVTRYNETDWAAEKVWMLADTRYSRRASHLTLFATNNDPHKLLPVVESVGYLYSRMRQGTLVELRGDLRGAAK